MTLDEINLLLTSFALHRTIHIQLIVVVTQILPLCTQIVENLTTLVVTLVVSLEDSAKSAPFDSTICRRCRHL
jgi:hypothetical protein